MDIQGGNPLVPCIAGHCEKTSAVYNPNLPEKSNPAARGKKPGDVLWTSPGFCAAYLFAPYRDPLGKSKGPFQNRNGPMPMTQFTLS